MRHVRFLLAAVALLVLIPGSAVHAAVGDLECTETDSTTYSPGLTDTEQPETVTVDDVQTCTSSDRTLTGGVLATTVHATRSCDDLLVSSSGQYTISWNNGNTSTISYSRSSTYVDGTLVIDESGSVTECEFAGDSSTHVVVFANVDLTACLSDPGLQSLSGTGVYAFS
jgi:hypothetical protein